MDRDLRSLRLWFLVEGGGGEGGVVGVGSGLASLDLRDRTPAGLTVKVTVSSGFKLLLEKHFNVRIFISQKNYIEV